MTTPVCEEEGERGKKGKSGQKGVNGFCNSLPISPLTLFPFSLRHTPLSSANDLPTETKKGPPTGWLPHDGPFLIPCQLGKALPVPDR